MVLKSFSPPLMTLRVMGLLVRGKQSPNGSPSTTLPTFLFEVPVSLSFKTPDFHILNEYKKLGGLGSGIVYSFSDFLVYKR